MLKFALPLAALLICAPAAAQDVARPAAPAAAGALSPEGQRLLDAYIAERDAKLSPLARQKRELDAKMAVLLTPEGYDEAQLAATTAQIHAIEEQVFEARTNGLLTLLKQLPEADRSAFLKSLRKDPAPLPAGPGR